MAKAFYTQDEAADALETDETGLKRLVDDGRLTEYRDGATLMYKGSQIEKLVGEGAGGLSAADSGGPIGLADSGLGAGAYRLDDSDTGGAAGRSTGGSVSGSMGGASAVGIPLGDSSGGSMGLRVDDSDTGDAQGSLGGVRIDDSRTAKGARVPGSSGSPLLSEDTGSFAVSDSISGRSAGASQSGITIFEDDDVDPSAQTSLGGTGDQIALEGIGSGSGLLDLTQEPDDTSFGAETFDEIMPESSVAGGTVAGLDDSDTGIDRAAAPAGTRQAVAVYEPVDPSAPIFGGLAGGAAAAVLIGLLALSLSVVRGDPGFLSFLVGEGGVALGPALGLLLGLPVIGAIIGVVGAKMGNA